MVHVNCQISCYLHLPILVKRMLYDCYMCLAIWLLYVFGYLLNGRYMRLATSFSVVVGYLLLVPC
jgi:hypothetical protein